MFLCHSHTESRLIEVELNLSSISLVTSGGQFDSFLNTFWNKGQFLGYCEAWKSFWGYIIWCSWWLPCLTQLFSCVGVMVEVGVGLCQVEVSFWWLWLISAQSPNYDLGRDFFTRILYHYLFWAHFNLFDLIMQFWQLELCLDRFWHLLI